ncbi:MAG: nitroreductase family protein [Candidatus Omnitrophica bacterium]|nr:nitroreductase family protein [Candidatus Omnitrophota bacterium]
MDFWEVVTKRRSVRSFTGDDVPLDKIKRLIQAAHLAPSGNNSKNWAFIVVRGEETKNKMRQDIVAKIDELASRMGSKKAKDDFLAYSNYFTFFDKAPVVIAVVMKPYDSLSMRIIKRYETDTAVFSDAGLQNVSAAIENMLLAATSMGLGTCWMTGPMIARKNLEVTLGISGEDSLVALIPVGVPSAEVSAHILQEDLGGVVRYI